MPIEFGRRINPSWDALRTLTLTGGEIAEAALNVISGGGGLENKIYTWHANLTSLDAFTPDATGLAAALLAVHDGDAMTIPAVTIALTAAVTIPIGLAVLGLSRENTILSFTTLSGATAVTLSARSVLEHLTVTVAGTQPLIGVDARAAKAQVREVTVNMASHANNIKIYAGWPE